MMYSPATVRRGRVAGFTLVEMIVYIAILALISLAGIMTILSLDDLFSQYRAEQRVFRSAHTALERIMYDIREADTVTAADSSIDGTLTLTGHLGVVTFSTSSDALHVTVDGVDQGALTEEDVVVTELRFYNYNDVTEFARVQMTLTTTVGETTVTRTFNTGAVLRGSYE